MIQIVLDTNEYGWYLTYVVKGVRQQEAASSFVLISRLQQTKK